MAWGGEEATKGQTARRFSLYPTKSLNEGGKRTRKGKRDTERKGNDVSLNVRKRNGGGGGSGGWDSIR